MLRSRGAGTIFSVIIGFFVLVVPTSVLAAHGDHVVIAEVQVGGASAKDEFIELYNQTGATISIEGWRLSRRTASGSESNLVTTFGAVSVPSHGSLLVAHPEGAFAPQADATYSTRESLAANNTVVLYGPIADGARPVIDLVGWGTASSVEAGAAPDIPSGQSIERKPGGTDGNGQDTNDNAADFFVQLQPTPQNTSVTARPATSVCTGSASVCSGDNGQGEAGSGTTATTDTGEEHEEGATITEPTTGTTSADGAAASGPSDLSTPAADTTSETTPTTNSSSTASSSALVEPSRSTMPLPAPTHIRINEFVSDPAEGDEWIELINIGPVPVNLADWIVEDGAEARTTLTGAIGINEQRFIVVAKPKGQLNNSGDRIVLKNSGGSIVDAVTYGDWNDGKTNDNAPVSADPASIARVVDGVDTDNDRADFVRTEMPTRGSPNIVSALPSGDTPEASHGRTTTPQVLIVINELHPNPPGDDRTGEFIELANLGQQTTDLTGWRIRDELGAEYVVTNADGPAVIPAGGFLLLSRARTGIALNDTGGETIRLYKPGQERATSVAEYSGEAAESVSWARASDGRWSWTTELTPDAANVVIVPNRSPDAVFSAPKEVDVGAIATFDGSDSADPDREAIAYLWNFGDKATEADVATDAVGRYVYERPGTYNVTLAVTDTRATTVIAKRRVIVRAPPKDSEENNAPAALASGIRGPTAASAVTARTARGGSASSRRSTSRRSASSPVVSLALGDLPNTELGTRVAVQGMVTAPPATVGKQIFYIADDDAGVQVFFGKRTIPALIVGDAVEIRGELREVGGALRVGIASASDVRVLGRGASVEPTSLRIHDANTERIGELVAIEGEVVEVRGRTVSMDDGSEEIRVALPVSGVGAGETVRVGDTMRAAGILSRTSAGYRILARSMSDITTVAEAASRDRMVAGAASPPLRNDLELAMLGGGGSALLVSSLWRRRRLFALAASGAVRAMRFAAGRRIG